MFFDIVTADGEGVLGLTLNGGPAPVAGDVFQTPDNKVYRVVQRTFMFRQQHIPGQPIDLSQGRPVQMAVQCVVQYVGMVGEENPNAIIQ